MADRNFQMKARTETGWDNLFPATKMEQIEGLALILSNLEAIAKGASRAKAFDTITALDAWLAVPANTVDLQVGDNLYVRDVDVPDYWWDGTQKRQLATEKVVLALASAAADGLMSKGDYAKLASIAENANNYTAPTTASQAQAEAGTATTVLSWTPQRVAQAVRGGILTGLSTAASTVITATDTVLSAFGKLQAQITERLSKSGDTMTGTLKLKQTAASVEAPLKIPASSATVAPSNLENGDIWVDNTSVQARINGTTRALYHAGNASTAALTTATQTEAETSASTVTTVRAWTPQRISQAIAAQAKAAVPTITAGNTAPANPKAGDIWFDYTNA